MVEWATVHNTLTHFDTHSAFKLMCSIQCLNILISNIVSFFIICFYKFCLLLDQILKPLDACKRLEL